MAFACRLRRKNLISNRLYQNQINMNKVSYIRLLSITLLLCLFIGSVAQTHYSVNDVPNVQLRDFQQFVSDPDTAISYGDIQTLNIKIKEMKDSLNVQCAVVVLPAITDKYATAKDFATQLFEAWGIGDKETNKGLLIVLITGEGGREIAFETGYGLEEKLPDGTCKLIQTNKMKPFLAEGNYGAGLIAGVNEVEKVLKGTSDLVVADGWPKEATWFIVIWIVLGLLVIGLKSRSAKPKVQEGISNYMAAIKSNDFMGVGCLLAALFFPAFILFAIFRSVAGKNKGGANSVLCESCKASGGVKLIGEPKITQTAIPGQDGMKEYSFKCSKCGHVHTELVPYVYVEKKSSSSSNSSWSSSGSSGSSTRGGSWGGGRSGGGGASTKF